MYVNKRTKHFFCGFQVTAKQILPIYLKVVESSYFNSSDKVNVRHKLKCFLLKYLLSIMSNFVEISVTPYQIMLRVWPPVMSYN